MSVPTTYPFDFDPTYGMRLDDLLAIRPPPSPPGFDAFWKARYRRAIAADPKPILLRSKAAHPDWHVLDITYTSTGGFPIGGWLLLPRTGPVRRGLVVGHGYGGRDQPDYDLPVEETALLFPCFRGLSRSSRAPIPADAAGHVLYNIDSPDHYIIGGCVDDLWLGVSTLLALYPWLSGHIGYSGISLGGGVGALAIPFDTRIARGHLVVPTFGDRRAWLTLPTVGSAHSVQAYATSHPHVLETLTVFDAAVAASRITVPMLTAVALFDPAVAPPCQFAIANALPKYNETFILDAGHFDYDGSEAQEAVLRDKVRQFFKDL
ncbi:MULTISPECIES: acetylxylan esterase [Rhizobium]|uniref:Acetylxylan esterase n=1 Tax=Rhizobium rhododendri TaxID=2506430 RepID=A0ABY8IED6_9HYPH|nr:MULTISPECIES: acetylxylan esterase [Rhizobium]MBZ5759177.1 acetylxylan esterase [Rhizobium sp. VS19-DR96]MBZ5763992.1 acetylxylan esterase [Rhizobium sp. VS19-DR129.2]MBZ5771536.1 acetylxylan esterase [Rhizobium sp. VS19-DRK62.2]MBZ5783777.1 acetylxylan esterase [Rhizobium sp. VS19-DR121]MBZ5801549.1 acetylxylan esterase [Rhizobium sp. VS19-DR181]